MLKLGEGRLHRVPEPGQRPQPAAVPTAPVLTPQQSLKALQPEAAEAAAKKVVERLAPSSTSGSKHWLWRQKSGQNVTVPDKPVYEHETKLSGVTKSGYDFASLERGQTVLIVPDPFGRVVHPDTGHDDEHALSIQDEAGVHIGYVPRSVAAVFSQRIRSGQIEATAYVSDITGGTDGYHHGVVVNLVYVLTADALKAERQVQKKASAAKGGKRA